MFCRYVGNRLHALFHLAGVIFTLRDELIHYFTTDSTTGRELKRALRDNLQNPHLMFQSRSLNLLVKVLTAPWMRLFYNNVDGKTNLQMADPIRTVLTNLKSIVENPLSIFTKPTYVFNESLPNDDKFLTCLMKYNMQPSDEQDQEFLNKKF